MSSTGGKERAAQAACIGELPGPRQSPCAERDYKSPWIRMRRATVSIIASVA
jgi:hypothetical protein